MKRADEKGLEIDKEKWTIVCSEQGIGDQVLFLHSMNEAIEELGKILYIVEKRMHSIIKRSFPKLVVACPGVTYDWSRSNLKKNGYIPLVAFLGDTEKKWPTMNEKGSLFSLLTENSTINIKPS